MPATSNDTMNTRVEGEDICFTWHLSDIVIIITTLLLLLYGGGCCDVPQFRAQTEQGCAILFSMWAAARMFLLCVLFPAVLAAQETNPDELLKQAMDEQQRGDFSTAIRDYRKVLELRPDEVQAKVNLGAALVRVGQFDEAITMYRSALPALKDKNPVLLNLALAYYKKGDFEHAREQFTILHDAKPDDVRVVILLGDSDLRTGRSEDALHLLEP